MARDELKRVISENGVVKFSSAKDWVDFYARLKNDGSNGSSRDVNAQRERVLRASKQSIATRADALRTGKSILRMKVKFGAASSIPALRHILCRRLSRKFANETLNAFGLGDEEELEGLQRQFDVYFHPKKRSMFGISKVGSKIGSLLFNVAKNTLISHIFILQTALSKGLQAASGYKTIRKRMKEMIRLAAEKAVEIHRIYFVPLVMGELIELPSAEEEKLLFVCYGCGNLVESPESFTRCRQCLTSEAIFCSGCTHELEPGGLHLQTHHRNTWRRIPVSKVIVDHTDEFDLEDTFRCSTCRSEKPRLPFFAKCLSQQCGDSNQCIQCFFEDPPAHGHCSSGTSLPDFKLFVCSTPQFERVVAGMDRLSMKPQGLPEATKAAIQRSSTMPSRRKSVKSKPVGRSRSMAIQRPPKRSIRRRVTG